MVLVPRANRRLGAATTPIHTPTPLQNTLGAHVTVYEVILEHGREFRVSAVATVEVIEQSTTTTTTNPTTQSHVRACPGDAATDVGVMLPCHHHRQQHQRRRCRHRWGQGRSQPLHHRVCRDLAARVLGCLGGWSGKTVSPLRWAVAGYRPYTCIAVACASTATRRWPYSSNVERLDSQSIQAV